MDDVNKPNKEFALMMLNLQLDDALFLVSETLANTLFDELDNLSDDEALLFVKKIMTNPFVEVEKVVKKLGSEYIEFANSPECKEKIEETLKQIENNKEEFLKELNSEVPDFDSFLEDLNSNSTSDNTNKVNKKLQ